MAEAECKCMGKRKGKGTPLRTFRINEEVWAGAKARAAAEGRTLSDVARSALARYAAAPGPGPLMS